MNCRVHWWCLFAAMIGFAITGCSKPLDPSFFSGTWKPPDNVSGVGMMFIDIPRGKVVLGLGVRPREFVVTQVTRVEGGFHLRLKHREFEGVVQEFSFQQVSDGHMRITDEVGDSDVWSRVEASGLQDHRGSGVRGGVGASSGDIEINWP